MNWHLLAAVQADVVTAYVYSVSNICIQPSATVAGFSSGAIPHAGFRPLAIRAKGGPAVPPLRCPSPLEGNNLLSVLRGTVSPAA